MNTKRLVVDACLSALAVILYLFVKFPLPFFPPFLEMNFSMLPIIIALLLFGFKDASIVAILRVGAKLLFMGSTTAYVGELADFLMSFIILFIVFLVSRWSKKPIIIAISLVLSWVLAGIITNLLVNIPLYIRLMGMTYESLAELCSVIPGITADNFLIKYTLYAVIPFNALLSIIVTTVSVPVCARLSKIDSINNLKCRRES